jgi:hypothetical protein
MMIAKPGNKAMCGASEIMRLRIGQHAAPAWQRRLCAEPDIGKCCFGEDGERELDGTLHDQQVGDVGQNVFGGDPRLGLAGHPRREHEIPGPQRQRGAARQPGEHRHVENADGDDGVDRAGPEDGGDHDRQQQRREGKDQIVAAHDDLVEQAAPAGGGIQPQRHADDHADADGDESHGNRHARADHDHRKHVAPEMICSEPMLKRRSPELSGDVEPGRVERRPDE